MITHPENLCEPRYCENEFEEKLWSVYLMYKKRLPEPAEIRLYRIHQTGGAGSLRGPRTTLDRDINT